MNFVTYEQFGAKGNGKADDMPAIAAAHAYANEHSLPVRAKANAHYYIGHRAITATVMTDTDWSTARFTVDDRTVEDRTASIFRVVGRREPFSLPIPSLTRGQTHVTTAPGVACYTVITEQDIRRFIRRGLNQNSGSAQTDNFELTAEGEILHPLLWDFPRIDQVTAYPLDEDTLTLRGGFFTTVANRAPSAYTYYARNISVERSSTVLTDLHHTITGEGESGAPYNGFVTIRNCARVRVEHCFFTPHKTYVTIGAAGKPVSMGSYDIRIESATDVTLKDCFQMHDILDNAYWGLIASNFCKNITLDGCVFSRMDAHQGVLNCTVRGCTLGHMGFNAIGHGLLTIENSELYGRGLVNFRPDYGSSWCGDLVLRDVIWHPCCGREARPHLFTASNDGQHDFGYPCSLPRQITLERVHVDDSHVPEDYSGMHLWNNYNQALTPETAGEFTEKYPYAPCERLIIRGLTTASGKPWSLCANPLLTPALEVVEE